jgi:hypothetical protein
MAIIEFDPDAWLTSLQRSLEDYVMGEIDAFIKQGANDVGLEVYDVVFDWPDAAELAKAASLPKTIIHFVIDDIDNRPLGFGNNAPAATEELHDEPDPDLIRYHEGNGHVVNFDVGVWASDHSGGSTSRLVVYQMLYQLFGTELGKQKTRETIDVEIQRFNGGRFIIDKIGDVRVFRIIDCEMVARVFSRTTGPDLVIVDKDAIVDDDLTIDNIEVS